MAITWIEDLAKGREESRIERKLLFVDFHKTPG